MVAAATKTREKLTAAWMLSFPCGAWERENNPVTAIELVDSSSITLLAVAENAFPGTRTKASIKWHANFDLLSGSLVWFQLTPGKRHDRKCFPDFASLTGKLVIFDLGYWD